MFSYKKSSNDYLDYLRKIGIKVGKNCVIFCPRDTSIDVNNPHLLEIGNNVKITGPATILTHDYSTCVLNQLDKKIYGKQRKTVIGNNVFIGCGAIILSGTKIGDNVVIGAGSVVSGKIESNSVYGGNPCKKIMSIEEYKEKIEKNQIKNAVEIYKEYKERYNKIPEKGLFYEYFYLFENDFSELRDLFRNKLLEEQITEEMFNKKSTIFKSYDDFIKYCERMINDEKN